jgi:lipopolysaccharide transport system ATP-binding protein
MSETVIKVENLSKKYILRHQRSERYTALRDVIASGARGLGKKFLSTFASSTSLSTAIEEEFYALRDICFEVKQGDRVGIIGRNGAGKSTLLKILSRITAPTRGQVKITGRVASLLEVGTGFHPELTGRENIYLNGAVLGMKKIEIRSRFDAIVEFAGVERFLDTPVKHFSTGMYLRLAFAVAAHLEPDILVVDEVLAVGDVQFQRKCLGKMEDVGKEGRTVLFVTHNMSALERLCTKAIYLEDGIAQGPFGINDGIKLYFDQSAKNREVFHGEVLSKVDVKQVGNRIFICAEYRLGHKIKMPCLGFVISDYCGMPICGSNPVLDNVDSFPEGTSRGRIKVAIEHPKLLDGTYTLSLWFGDGHENYFEKRDCLSFVVTNMVGEHQLHAAIVGHVFPLCEWKIEAS